MLNNGLTMRWSMRWKHFRLRRRMKRFARLLVKAREAKPRLLSYLEELECRSERQSRELDTLRWTMTGERFADLDQELDRQVARDGIDAPRPHSNLDP